MTYRLHGFAQSGNTYKVALYLACAGLPFEAVPVDYGKGETRDPAWRDQNNIMGEAPVLEVDGAPMTQSGAILVFLQAKTGKFAPQPGPGQYEALRWMFFDNHKFTSYLATYRFFNTFKTPADPDPAVVGFLRQRMEAAFAVVEAHMAGRAFVADEAPTIADFSMMGYLFFPDEELGFALADTYPNIAAWRERMRALPGWVAPYELLPSADMPRR